MSHPTVRLSIKPKRRSTA